MRRLYASAVLVAYLACALLLPELHRRHHAAHGDDHVHTADGIVWLQHAAFDADLAALDLSEVVSAGALEVDCSLAEYTLVSCAEARPGHALTFGDQLSHEHSPTVDPTHGRGSILHLQGWLVAPAPVLLPPPPAPRVAPLAPLIVASVSSPSPARALARGPPRIVVF